MSLFDLEGDPGEQHNVATRYPDIVARLKSRYDRAMAETKKEGGLRPPTLAPTTN